MLKRKLSQKLIFLALSLGLASSAFAYSEIAPVGTLKYDPSKAYSGYNLVDVAIGKEAYTKLFDMNGNEVHRWKNVTGMPSKLLPNGNIIASRGRWNEGSQDSLTTQELDWNGNTIWEFRNTEGVAPIEGSPVIDGKSYVSRQHHDLQREGVGVYFSSLGADVIKKDAKTLILAHKNVKVDKINSKYQLVDDLIIEVDAQGNIVWEYSVSDHVEDYGFDEAAYKAMQSYPPSDNPRAVRTAELLSTKVGAGFDWFHANAVSYLGENKWYDQGDKRFHPENILVNSRECSLFAIIDKQTKKVVWRVGPDFSQGSEDAKIQQVIGTHGVHMIPKSLPGGSNILVFDNGGLSGYGEPNIMSPTGYLNARRDHSRVIEIDPTTKEIVWQYTYSNTNKRRPPDHFQFHFYSPFTSTAQRLPNGNTVITEGDTARVFEVTTTGEIVWEYVVPEAVIADGPLYRVYRVPYEWASQIAKPAETAVVPPAPLTFTVPDVNGKHPTVIAN